MTERRSATERWHVGPGWRPRPETHWESWSINGEACFTGLDPAPERCERLAHSLCWLIRDFASESRRVHTLAGILPFTAAGPRTPTLLARRIAIQFQVPLMDPPLIRERVLRRGGPPDACRWPSMWLEEARFDYLLPDRPIPRPRDAPWKLVVLAQERQAFVPSGGSRVGAAVLRGWIRDLDVLAGVDRGLARKLLRPEQHGFMASILALVHEQPAARAQTRPDLDESLDRHEALVQSLRVPAEERDLPLAIHALWRVPPGLTWCEPGGDAWMRYPAVSFAIAASALHA